jgi:hypothetical protein
MIWDGKNRASCPVVLLFIGVVVEVSNFHVVRWFLEEHVGAP